MIGTILALMSDGLLSQTPVATDSRYSILQLGGVENEVGEFLYGLVRMMKPRRVLETGTFVGIAASFIAVALKKNKSGKLTTIEYVEEHVEQAMTLFTTLNLTDYIEVIHSRVEDWDPKGTQYEMIIIDSNPPTRLSELVRFWGNLRPSGIVVIHDLPPHMFQPGPTLDLVNSGGFGDIPGELRDLIINHNLQSFHFDTPTGLYVAQKVAQGFHTSTLLRR